MNTKKRKPFIAAFLSSVTPGLGQVYNGQIIKGGILFLATFLLIFVLSFTGLQYQFYGLFAIILFVLFFWLFIVGESFFAARKIKEITLKPYNRWYVYLILALLAFGLDVISADFFMKEVLGIKFYKIATNSMQPSVLKDDHVMVNLKYYKSNNLKRGDLVVFEFPANSSKEFLKRVIALEGEKLEIKNKRIFINDRPIAEDYKIHSDSRVYTDKSDSPYNDFERDNFGPSVIPFDHCFVMGDNRDNSMDSRHMSHLPLSNIKGKAVYIYFSWDILRIGNKLK